MDEAVTPATSPMPDPPRNGVPVPERTCIGCRRRDARSSLLRLVADPAPSTPSVVEVLVDPAGRLPGRGAWIHPCSECLDQATRRRAFGRALRLAAGVDLSQVHAYVEAREDGHG